MTLSFVLFLPSSGGNQSITKLHCYSVHLNIRFCVFLFVRNNAQKVPFKMYLSNINAPMNSFRKKYFYKVHA